MLRMSWKSRIMDRFDLRMLVQERRDGERVFGMSLHPIGQGPNTAQDQPAIKRRGNSSYHPLNRLDAFKEGFIVLDDHCSPKHITMSTKICRHGVHDHIGPQLKGMLEHGGCPGVITCQQHSSLVGKGCDLSKVGHSEQRIPRC